MTQRYNPPHKRQALSRRELLKVLAALGGAVTASSLLPEKWARPEIGAGVLPAHAQASLFTDIVCTYDPQDLNPVYPGTTVTAYITLTPPLSGIPLRLVSYLNDVEDYTGPNLTTNPSGQCQDQFTLPGDCEDKSLVVAWLDPATGVPYCQSDPVPVEV